MTRTSQYPHTNSLQIFFLLLPGVIVFALFTLYPIGKLFLISFFDWKIGLGQISRFVFLDNYRDVFTDKIFGIVIVNTLLYALFTVPLQIIIGLCVAVLIQNIYRGRILFRVSYYLPVITSWVIVSLIFRYLFQTEGLLNYFLKDLLHAVPENIRWLDYRFSGLTVAGLLGVWKGIGWNMVVFLAALQTVPVELYEVAALDGCGRFRKFLYVTIPSIKNTIFFALVMLTIGAFNVFTSIKLMTDGRPAHQTDVVWTWMYYNAFGARQMGYAAALSYIVAMLITVITIIEFGYFRRYRD